MGNFRNKILFLVVPLVCLLLVGCVQNMDAILSNSLQETNENEQTGDLELEEDTFTKWSCRGRDRATKG